MDANVAGDNRGILSTGSGATNLQADRITLLGTLRPVAEVKPLPSPFGVPAVGLFVGREDDLSRLDEAVTADTPANLDAGLANFAVALEPELAGAVPAEALRERALTWLCTHPGWLLVLDSVTDPADVRQLIARAAKGRYILTTRRANGWHGTAQPLALNVLAPRAARELVAQTLGPELPHLLDGVDDLCGLLGYLPLALDQAAAYMVQTRVSATDYLRLLHEHPAAMLAEAAEGTDPTRTVARIWTLTLDRLSDDPLCGDILRILAWLAPDGIPRSLLDYLAPETQVLRALGRLATYSMITYDGQLTPSPSTRPRPRTISTPHTC